MKNKLEELRKVIISSVPDIVKLEFGCEVMDFQKKRIFISVTEEVKYTDGTKGNFCINLLDPETVPPRLITRCNQDRADVESLLLLGRKIGIADVLLTIAARNKMVPSLTLYSIQLGIGEELWNLSQDDLNLQSEETINFLHSILCKK